MAFVNKRKERLMKQLGPQLTDKNKTQKNDKASKLYKTPSEAICEEPKLRASLNQVEVPPRNHTQMAAAHPNDDLYDSDNSDSNKYSSSGKTRLQELTEKASRHHNKERAK